LVTCGLIAAYLFLHYNFKKYFAKHLQPEATHIKITFIVFSSSFIASAVVWILVISDVITDVVLPYQILFFFFDILPLSLIMGHHLKAFRALQKVRESDETDLLRSSATSRFTRTSENPPSPSDTASNNDHSSLRSPRGSIQAAG